MDAVDKRVLGLLQCEYPLCERPYGALAEKAGLSEEELWGRVERLLCEGVIRRIGASMDSAGLGFSSTLAAVRVEASRVEEAAEVIGGYDEVTHSYVRGDEYNIWFTVIAASAERVAKIVGEIRERLELEEADVLNLPMKRMFKLDTRFDVQS
jgi:DNA-binding Lrp family transcriptional regulator